MPNFSISLLAKYFLDDSSDLMTSASNLIIATIKNREIDYNFLHTCAYELLKLNFTFLENKNSNALSKSEVTWLLMLGYAAIHHEKLAKFGQACLKRSIKSFEFLFYSFYNNNINIIIS